MTLPARRSNTVHRVYPAEPQPRPRNTGRLIYYLLVGGCIVIILGWERAYEWTLLAIAWGWMLLFGWAVVCVLALLSLQMVGKWLTRIGYRGPSER